MKTGVAKRDKFQTEWEKKIFRGKRVKKAWEDQFRVRMARQYFEGQQNPGWGEDEWITVNKIYAHVLSMLPTLYSVDPYYYVRVKRTFNPLSDFKKEAERIFAFNKKGQIRQAMLNYLIKELNLKASSRLSILDMFFEFACMKAHYTTKNMENPDAGQVMLDDDKNPMLASNGEPLVQPDLIPIDERYKVSRVHPKNIIIDPDAGPLEDSWTWIAEEFTMTLDQVKEDRRFSKEQKKLLEGRFNRENKGMFKGFFERNKRKKKDDEGEEDIIRGWEVYHITKKRFFVIVDTLNDPVIPESPLPPGVEDHPYAIKGFTPRDDSPYPIPPISQALDPQLEYNMSRSRILKHRKRFNRKYQVFLPGLSDPSEASKLASGDDGTFIMTNMPEEVVRPIKDAPLDQQTYLELAALSEDMVEIFGTGGNARGIADTDSATEAAAIDKRLALKEGDKVADAIDLLTTIGRKLDQQVQTHIREDEAIRITGPDGEAVWEIVRPADYEAINGEFEYGIETGSTSPRLPQTERAQWIAFWSQVIIPFPAILTKPKLMKKVAAMFEIEDEALLEEMRQLGLQVVSGQIPGPANTGSQAGVSEDNPVAKLGGSAGGPLGGTNNGGGAASLSLVKNS